MQKPEISYALPVSCLEVSGKVTTTHDAVTGESTTTAATTVSLHTHGLTRDQTLQILTGTLRDTALSVQLTEDGMLTSADSQSDGQLGKVLIGAVGTGAAIAGALAGAVPGAAATAGVLGGLVQLEVAHAYLERAAPPALEQTEEARAYAKRYPAQASLREQYADLVETAQERIAALAAGMQGGNEDDWQQLSELRRQHQLLQILREELGLLEAHFAAWRASTITSHTTAIQRCFSLDVLRGAGVKVTEADVTFAAAAHESVRLAWERLGVAVVMDPAGEVHSTPPATRPNAVVVRVPRRVRLSVYEKTDSGPVLREERPHLVVDAACETHVIPFRRSLWAKRSTKLGFGRLGNLTSYAVMSGSSAVALADAGGSLPAAASSGLEQATKLDQEISSMAVREVAARGQSGTTDGKR